MPKPEHEDVLGYIRRTADDGVGGLASEAQIQAKIEEDMATLGNIVTDLEDLPPTATSRANGVFTDAQSAMEYLDEGGLVAIDDMGEYVPMSWVHFFQYFDEGIGTMVWEVWIEKDSP